MGSQGVALGWPVCAPLVLAAIERAKCLTRSAAEHLQRGVAFAMVIDDREGVAFGEAQAGRGTVQLTEKEAALFPLPTPGFKCLMRDMKSAAPGIKR